MYANKKHAIIRPSSISPTLTLALGFRVPFKVRQTPTMKGEVYEVPSNWDNTAFSFFFADASQKRMLNFKTWLN